MDIQLGDKLFMKKKHPCGGQVFTVNRIGMDFKLCCDRCGHEIMLPRSKAEKAIKKLIRNDGEN